MIYVFRIPRKFLFSIVSISSFIVISVISTNIIRTGNERLSSVNCSTSLDSLYRLYQVDHQVLLTSYRLQSVL